MYVGVLKWRRETFVQLNKSRDWPRGCLILTFSCPSSIYEPKIIFYFIFTLVQVSASKWPIHDCIGSEIGLCTKDCFAVKSPTLSHVELCAYFASFLCNFWETFTYTVRTFWAKNHILFRIFTLATWCTSFGVQRTRPWLKSTASAWYKATCNAKFVEA